MKVVKILLVFVLLPLLFSVLTMLYLPISDKSSITLSAFGMSLALSYWFFLMIGVPAILIIRRFNIYSPLRASFYGAWVGLIVSIAMFGLPKEWISLGLSAMFSFFGASSGALLAWATASRGESTRV